MVALTNEYAGSDGDIFSHSFKLLKLGPLVGKRTWGGVIGISPSHSLIDGGFTTQPEYSFWFADVGWKVENYGADPDVEVDYPPSDYVSGRDPQLERALKICLENMGRSTLRLPTLEEGPDLSLPSI
jgi:tricorn protease